MTIWARKGVASVCSTHTVEIASTQGRRCLVADLWCTFPGAAASVPVRVATVHLESIRFNKAVCAKQLATILPRLRKDPFGGGGGGGGGESIPKSGANRLAGARAPQPALALLCGDFNLCSTWREENDPIAADPFITDAWPATHRPGYVPATLRSHMPACRDEHGRERAKPPAPLRGPCSWLWPNMRD